MRTTILISAISIATAINNTVDYWSIITGLILIIATIADAIDICIKFNKAINKYNK